MESQLTDLEEIPLESPECLVRMKYMVSLITLYVNDQHNICIYKI
jgi:hypothetical protein